MIGNGFRMRIILAIVLVSISGKNLIAQSELSQPRLRFYLSEDSTSYMGFAMLNQVWTRLIQNNPDINGLEESSDFDIGIRRSRLIFYTYLMDKVYMYTEIGSDGLTFNQSEKPQMSLYNAQTEFIVDKNKLQLGFGLSTWNGISRYNNSSAPKRLVLDNPVFTYPIAGIWDRFGRQLGVYAKGTVSKLNYRLSIAKPFLTGTESAISPKPTARKDDKWAYKGYLSWQFLDNEGQALHMTMNNLGRARIVNFGAGFYYHPDAMFAQTDQMTPDVSDIFLLSTDLFIDLPLKNGGAMTSYLGYFNYDFGENYLRAAGRMNVSTMDSELAIAQGTGNSEWEVGTGSIVRGELGYLFPKSIIKAQIQPFGAFTYKNFEALDEASTQFDFGINILQRGHNIKWTFQGSSRPIYAMVGEQNVVSETKWQFILQTQIFF